MTLPQKTPQSRSHVATRANDKGQAVRRMSSDSAELSSGGSNKRPLPQSSEPANVQHQVPKKQRRSGNSTPPVDAAAKSQLSETNSVGSIQGGTREGLPRNQSTCIVDPNFLKEVVSAFEGVNESTRLADEAISKNPTFLAITEKYGDIAKDCLLESGSMRTSILRVICEVVQDLQKRRLTEVSCDLLESYNLVVQDAEKVKVKVTWLRTRLDEIKDAIDYIFDTKDINDERDRRAKQNEIDKKNLESKKAELEKLKAEIDRQESQLKSNTVVTEELSSKLSIRASKIQQFQNMPLMEAFP